MQADIRQYVETITDERKDLFMQLHDLVLTLYPQVSMKISYQMPKYTLDKGWLFLGYRKDGVSIYVGYSSGLAEFKKKYPLVKTGRGSINLKLTDNIPRQDLEDIIRAAMEDRSSDIKPGA